MRDILRSLFKKSDSEDLDHDISDDYTFTIKIDDLIVGSLKTEEGKWIFKYSEEFKNQDFYRRLTGFSDLNKEYKSEVLWPFFKIRIPGLKQPMIQEILQRENIDSKDEALLLKRFGTRTMTNPYILEVA